MAGGRTIEYCEDCKRIVGVGCVCGVPFAERVKSVAVDKSSLRSS